MNPNYTPKEFALDAIKKKTSIIPVGRDKKPLVLWKTFQERYATEKEIEKWWQEWPDANVAIVTGKISSLTVIDVEKGGDISIFPPTLTIRSGGGGWHLYYQYHPIPSVTRILPLTDIKSDGGSITAPPSIHASGGKYEVLERRPIAEFPAHLFGIHKLSAWKEKIALPILQGSRNNDYTSIVGALLARFPQSEWESVVLPLVVNHNQIQDKPLPDSEIATIFNSVAERESKKRNSGGIIKDIQSEANEDEIHTTISLETCLIHFKATNLVSSIMEASVTTWIEKPQGLSPELPFFLKAGSDTNKEQWARILSKAFDRKGEEVYPWTILITKATSEITRHIDERKQDFEASELVEKNTVWMVEPLIQEDQINTFFGLGGSAKTLLAIHHSIQLARQGVPSLFIDYENDASSWKGKLVQMGSDGKNLIYYDTEQIPLYDQVDKIRGVIKKHGVKLIIVDSASLATGDSTSDEKSVVRLMSALKRLKTTTLLIAHQRKNDGERTPIGSVQFENQARNVWNISSVSDDGENNILHVACKHTKANNTFIRKNPIGYKVTFGDGTTIVEPENAIANFEAKFTVKEQLRNVLSSHPAGLTYWELAELLGLSEGTVKKNLSDGKNKGLFTNREDKWVLGK